MNLCKTFIFWFYFVCSLYNNSIWRYFIHSIYCNIFHCVKSVQIRIFFWSVFSYIRTEYNLRVQSKYKKIRTRKISVSVLFSRSVPVAKCKFRVQTKSETLPKSVRIRSYCGPHFPWFGLNTGDTKYLSIFSKNAGKCGPE